MVITNMYILHGQKSIKQTYVKMIYILAYPNNIYSFGIGMSNMYIDHAAKLIRANI